MTDPEKQLTLDDLPPKVRKDLEAMCARLPSEFTYGNLRKTKLGWAISIYDGDGHHGGEIGLMPEPTEKPNPPWLRKNDPS